MKLRNTFEIFLSNVKLGQVVEFGNDVQKVVSVHDTTFEEATGNSDITDIYMNIINIINRTRV